MMTIITVCFFDYAPENKQFEPISHLIKKENHLNQTSMGSEC